MKENMHIPVFLEESIDLLKIEKNKKFIDCTFGRGGHSLEIIKKLNETGFLWSIDCDQSAIDYCNQNFSYTNFKIIKDFYSNIEEISKENSISEIDGIIFDLGVSSPQLDDKSRGFSYHGDNIIDMRMDISQKFSAIDLLATYSKTELNSIFKRYGEIRNPSYVTNAIIEYRKIKAITTTKELVDIIKENVHKKELFLKKHPARKYFQAIRMEINGEIHQIKKGITDASRLLKKGGRIVVISFHSLEDKAVKDVFKYLSRSEIPNEVPSTIDDRKFLIINKKIKITNEEIEKNLRSRSAKIRCLEKI